MPYSIRTEDGIQINNIPDNILQDDNILKERVEKARQERQPQPSGVFESETQTETITQPQQPEKEYAGFFDSAIGAFGDTVDISKLGFKAALPGTTAEESYADYEAKQALKPQRTRFSYADIEDAFKTGGFEGAKELLKQLPGGFGEAAGMIAPMLAAARTGAMVGSVVPGVGSVLGGIVGAALSSYFPQFGGNISEQAQKDIKEGKPVDIDTATAALYTIPQVALDIIPFGLGSIKRLAGMEKALPPGVLRARIAKEGAIPTAVKGFVTVGGQEVPAEIGQEMITKIQAGNDFLDEESIKEYKEVAALSFLTGGIGVPGALQRRTDAQQAIQTESDAGNIPPLMTEVPPTKEEEEDSRTNIVKDKKEIKFDKESAAALETVNQLASNINKLDLENANIKAQGIPDWKKVQDTKVNTQQINFFLDKIAEQRFTTREFAEEALKGQYNFNPSLKGLLQIQENEDGTFSVTKAIAEAISDLPRDEEDKKETKNITKLKAKLAKEPIETTWAAYTTQDTPWASLKKEDQRRFTQAKKENKITTGLIEDIQSNITVSGSVQTAKAELAKAKEAQIKKDKKEIKKANAQINAGKEVTTLPDTITKEDAAVLDAKKKLDAEEKLLKFLGKEGIQSNATQPEGTLDTQVVSSETVIDEEITLPGQGKRTAAQKNEDQRNIDIFNKLEETKGNADTPYAGLNAEGNINPPSKSDIRSSFAPILNQMEKNDEKQKLIQDKVTASAIYIGGNKGIAQAKNSLAEYVLGDNATTKEKDNFINENYAIRQLYESRREVDKNYLDLKGGAKKADAAIRKSRNIAITPKQKTLNLDVNTLDSVVQNDINNSIISQENVKNLYGKGIGVNNYQGAIPTVKNILKTNLVSSQFATIPEKTFKDVTRSIIRNNAEKIDEPMVKKETDRRIKEFDKNETSNAIKEIKNLSLDFKRNDSKSNWEIPEFLKTGAVFGSTETVYETVFLNNPVVVNIDGWIRVVYQNYTYEQAADNLLTGASQYSNDRGLFPVPKKVLKERQKLRDEFINSAIMQTYIKTYNLNPSQEIADFESSMARGNYLAANITSAGSISDKAAKDQRTYKATDADRIKEQVKREAKIAKDRAEEYSIQKNIESNKYDPTESKDANRFTEDEVKGAIGTGITDRVDVETGLLSDESPIDPYFRRTVNNQTGLMQYVFDVEVENASLENIKETAQRKEPLTNNQTETIVDSWVTLSQANFVSNIGSGRDSAFSQDRDIVNVDYELGAAFNNYNVMGIGSSNYIISSPDYRESRDLREGQQFHPAMSILMGEGELQEVWESPTIGEAIDKGISILERNISRTGRLLEEFSPAVFRKWINNKDIEYEELAKIPPQTTSDSEFEEFVPEVLSVILPSGNTQVESQVDAVPAGIGIIALSRSLENQLQNLKALDNVKNIKYQEIKKLGKNSGAAGMYSRMLDNLETSKAIIANQSTLSFNPRILTERFDNGLSTFIHETKHAATVNGLAILPSFENLVYSLKNLGLLKSMANDQMLENILLKGGMASEEVLKKLINNDGVKLNSPLVAYVEFMAEGEREPLSYGDNFKLGSLDIIEDGNLTGLVIKNGIQSSKNTLRIVEELIKEGGNTVSGALRKRADAETGAKRLKIMSSNPIDSNRFYVGKRVDNEGDSTKVYASVSFQPIYYADIPTTRINQLASDGFRRDLIDAYYYKTLINNMRTGKISTSGVNSREVLAAQLLDKDAKSENVFLMGTLSQKNVEINNQILNKARDAAKERGLRFYGLFNIKEFYAELQTNPGFSKFLASIESVLTKEQIEQLANPSTQKGYEWVNREATKLFNLLQDSLLMLGKMLGINVDNTLLSDSIAAASSLYNVGGSTQIKFKKEGFGIFRRVKTENYDITREEEIRNALLTNEESAEITKIKTEEAQGERKELPENFNLYDNSFAAFQEFRKQKESSNDFEIFSFGEDYTIDESFENIAKKEIKKSRVKAQGKETINVATPIGNIVLKVTQKQLKELRTARKEREKSFNAARKSSVSSEQLVINSAKKIDREDHSYFKSFKSLMKSMFNDPNKFWEDIEIKYVNAKAPLRRWEANLRRSKMLKVGVEGYNDAYNQLVLTFGKADNLLKDYLYEPLQNYATSLQSYIDIIGESNLSYKEEANAKAFLQELMTAQTAQERRKVLGWKNKPLNKANIIQLPDGSLTSPADMRNDIFKIITTLDFKSMSEQERTDAIKKYRNNLITLTDNNTKFSGQPSVDALGYSPTGIKSIDITSEEYNGSVLTYAQEEAFVKQYKDLKKSNPKVHKAIKEFTTVQSVVQKQTMKLNVMGNFTPAGALNIIDLYDWNFYIPLKGAKQASEIDIDPSTTLLSKELQKLEASFTGSSTQAENPFHQTIIDATVASNRAGRVNFTQAVYNAISTEVEYDKRDTIDTPKKPRLLDGEIVERFSYNERYNPNTQAEIKKLVGRKDTILHLADNGDVIVMRINDENMIRAIRGEFKARSWIVDASNTFTGFMGQMHTRFNPPFAPLNVIRDAVTDFIYLSTDLGISDGVGFANNIAQQLTKGGFQDTWKIAFMYTKGNIQGIRDLVKDEEKKGNMYPREMMEYLTNGGIISFSQALSNEGAQRKLDKLLNQGTIFKGRKAAVEFFDGYMGAFELATRVAAYTTFKSNYLAKNNAGPNPSPELLKAAQSEATVYAKRLSNFEEVGISGTTLGGYFMFFRPSAVGAARAFETFGVMFQDINTAAQTLPDYIKKDATRYKTWADDFNKRKSAAQTATGSLLGFGATMFALSVLLSGDDEDRRNKTLNDDLQRWSRFMRFDISGITGNPDDVFQFPWGFGPGGIAAIGAQMAGLFTARENTPGSVLGNIIAIGMDSFLPLPLSRMNPLDEPLPFALDTISPSAIRPLIEFTWNKNAFGQQIYRARSRGFGSAYVSGDNIAESYKDSSAWLLENTGINWSPNSVHFFLNNYVDGLSKISSNLYSMGLLAVGEKNFNPKTDVPGAFLNSFISRYSKVDQRAYGRITEELSELENDLKIFQIANPELYNNYIMKNPNVPYIITRYNTLKASLNKLNKLANDTRQTRRLTAKQRENNLKPIKDMQIIVKKNIVKEMESLLELRK